MNIALEDRALARKISDALESGDPDRATISSIEVQRAWKNVDIRDENAIDGLKRLSRVLDVAVPEVYDTNHVDRVFGPARSDRRTRIMSTIGPACRDVETLAKMIDAGMDVARLNFSHIHSFEDAQAWVDLLNAAMKKAGRKIEIMADLRGPKLRVGTLASAKTLEVGEIVTIGEGGQIPITPKSIVADVRVGHRLLIDDGRVELEIIETKENGVKAKVIRGGEAKTDKGVNMPDTPISIEIPTEKDLADIAITQKLGITLFAVSFVENAADLQRVRSVFDHPVKLIAKIERPAAVSNIDEIFEAADGIMVARGDAAVEIGDDQIPVIQRQIHTQGNKCRVPTGTATQMMESMMSGGRPSRSDASDVARAALEGSDFVMTSGETSIGGDPIGVIKAMSKILQTTERAIRTGTVSTLD